MEDEFKKFKKEALKKKILLLIYGGLALSMTRRSDIYYRIVKKVAKEWQKIDKKNLYAAIRRLYRSKMIEKHEDNDGTISIVLSEEGKEKILRYKLDDLNIEKPNRWDGQWRIVFFDIPEKKKKARDILTKKLKELGFCQMQKSVYIIPFECENEIKFVVELFEIAPYVRFAKANSLDIELHLRKHFNLPI